jgi:hypothetical protein
LQQFSILRERNFAKHSSGQGWLEELTRMAAVMAGSSVSRKRLVFFKWITVSIFIIAA